MIWESIAGRHVCSHAHCGLDKGIYVQLLALWSRGIGPQQLCSIHECSTRTKLVPGHPDSLQLLLVDS